MLPSFSRLAATVAAATLFAAALPAGAQTPASPAADVQSGAVASGTKPTKAQQRKQRRAQHKAARKAARAKNSAELKKLENAGYHPATGDPNYPQNLNDATKKVDGQ